MRTLIERLQNAPEPSRELSDLVLVALMRQGIVPALPPEERPHPTGNLADAASLVPPGRPWSLLVYYDGSACAAIGDPPVLSGTDYSAGPAMALTIAALEEREIADAWHA